MKSYIDDSYLSHDTKANNYHGYVLSITSKYIRIVFYNKNYVDVFEGNPVRYDVSKYLYSSTGLNSILKFIVDVPSDEPINAQTLVRPRQNTHIKYYHPRPLRGRMPSYMYAPVFLQSPCIVMHNKGNNVVVSGCDEYGNIKTVEIDRDLICMYKC